MREFAQVRDILLAPFARGGIYDAKRAEYASDREAPHRDAQKGTRPVSVHVLNAWPEANSSRQGGIDRLGIVHAGRQSTGATNKSTADIDRREQSDGRIDDLASKRRHTVERIARNTCPHRVYVDFADIRQ